MVTKDRPHLQIAIDEVLEKFVRFDYQILFGNLRFASAEKGSFRVTAMSMSDDRHLIIFFRNVSTGVDLGHVVVNKDSFDVVEEDVTDVIRKYTIPAFESMKVLISTGMIDPKYI